VPSEQALAREKALATEPPVGCHRRWCRQVDGVHGVTFEGVGLLVRLKRLLDESPWLQFTSECQRF
jgi:hypothetical protein